MKTIAILIATLVAVSAFAAESATTVTAPAKTEMKLAKKKEDKKADATKSVKPVTSSQNKKATTKTESAAPATK